MTESTVVRIASITKPLTACAAVLALEGNRDGLLQPILAHLPQLEGSWNASRTLNLEHLLSHTSGLYADLDSHTLLGLGAGDGALLEAGRLVVRMGQYAPVSAAWSYYSGNYCLAGAVLASTQGVTFEGLLSELVLDPAKMKDTVFSAPITHAVGHRGGQPVIEPCPRASNPSAGLWSTANDLLSFAAFLLDRQQLLRTVGVPRTRPGWPVQYGLGWRVANGVLYHGGDLCGYRSMILLAPAHRYAIGVVINDAEGLPAITELVGSLLWDDTGTDSPL